MRRSSKTNRRGARPDARYAGPGNGAGRAIGRNRLKPGLLMLEDRRLLSTTTTFTVSSTADTVDSQGNPLSGTLRWAVEQANAANTPVTINFELSNPSTITLEQLGKALVLNNTVEPITITGPGASELTVDANDEGGAIHIDAGVTATITGLTVDGGSIDVNNAGVVNNLGNLTISDCTLSGNSAISGFYNKGTATISDCTLTGNNNFFGAAIFSKGTTTVDDCTITGNVGARGAGICDYTGTTTVTGCTITGNSALGGGGGLYNNGNLTVTSCTISGNTGGGGGDLYNNKKGTAYVSESTLSTGSGFIDGGALNNQYGGTLGLSDCTITSSSALTGGGLYNAGTTTINQCTITGNTATSGQGGGIANGPLQSKAVVDITDSTLSGNTASNGGAGLFNNGIAALANVTLADNDANQNGSLLSADGGGVDNSGTATLVACTITGNTTTAVGGGLYNGGLGTLTVTLYNTIVAGNVGPGGAANDIAVGTNSSLSPAYIAGSFNLIGTGGDGGLSQASTRSGVSNTNNLIGKSDPGLAPLGDYGGPTETVALEAGSPAIGAGSKALEKGPTGQALATDQRGFALDSPTPDIGAFQTSSGALVVNTTGEGSAVPFGDLDLRAAVNLANARSGKVAITFSPTVFAKAQTITLSYGPLVLTNPADTVTITGPAAGVTISGGGSGRIFEVEKGVTATLSGLTLSDGSVSAGTGAYAGSGGGLLNLGTTTLSNCTVTGNSASLGGGVYSNAKLYLDDSTLSGNTAKSNGGGVYVRAGIANLDGCTISGNSATAGSGLFLYGTTSVTACTVNGNAGGSGIHTGGQVTLIDSTIVGNAGVGLNNTSGTVTMEACTVTGNGGTGLANNVGTPKSTIALTDTIVAGNGTSSIPADIGGTDAADVTGLYNLIGTGGSGGISSTNNLLGVVAPLLSALGNYGGPTKTVALLPGSPAIGAGTKISGVTTDERGEPLDATGSAPDIGAFQSQGFTLTPVAGSTPQSTGTGEAFANLLLLTVTANNAVEPVAGGLISFSAPVSGPTAILNSTTAVVSPTGIASVFATANATLGSYTVTASAAGVVTPASFSLANLIGLNFGGLSNPVITYGSSATFTGTLLSSTLGSPNGESVTVSVGGDSGTGQVVGEGTFSVTVDTANLSASGQAYAVTYSYTSDGNYANTTGTGSLTIDQAAPTVAVTDAGGPYTGSAFAATATVAPPGGSASGSLEGVSPTLAYYSGTYTNASQLAGLTPLSGAPTHAGSYTVLATFAGSTDFAAGSALADFTIATATPALTVTDSGGGFTGNAYSATATVAGVGGSPGTILEGVTPTLTYFSGTYATTASLSGLTPLPGAPSASGSYTVEATFPGSTDYAETSMLANFAISQATPTVNVKAAGGRYGSTTAPVTATVAGVSGSAGATLEGVGVSFTYYSGTYSTDSQLSGLTPLSGVPTAVGPYTVEATFPGSTDYTSASSVADFAIAQATPVLAVSNPGGTFDGSAFPTTDSVAGVVPGVDSTPGATLEGVGLTLSYFSGTYTEPSQVAGLTPLSAAPTGAGAYTVEVNFAGSTDYAAASALGRFTIATATPTVAVTATGGTYSLAGASVAATVAGVVPGVDNTPAATLEGVSPALTYYSGTYTNLSQLVGLTPLSGTPSHVGAYTAVADFPGSADYGTAESLADFSILKATPTVDVTDAGGPYTGSAYAGSATVTGVNGTAGAALENTAPTLTYYGGTYATVAAVAGHAPLSGAPVHAGAYTVLATFPGTTDYLPASAVADFSITQVTPKVTWNSPGTIAFGTPLSSAELDATIYGATAPNPVYTPGTGAILGAGDNQVLSVTFTPTDSIDYATVHASTTIDVTPATPTLSVSAPGGTFDGSPFVASVTVAGTGGAAPASSLENVAPVVTYYAGTGTTGTSMGQSPPTAPGTYTVVADFPGSADYTSTQSNPVTFTIAPGAPAISLALSGGSITYGQPVSFTATVAGGSAVEGGTVTFYDGTAPLGTATIGASGQATLTVPALGVGTHSITAAYGGSSEVLSATSSAATESVAKAGTQLVLVPQPIFKGKKVKSLGLEAEVKATGSAVPTGTVTFEIEKKAKKKTTEQVLGTIALSGGAATLTVKPNQVLKKAITVVYGGGADFESSTATTTLTSSSLKSLARPMVMLQHRGRARVDATARHTPRS